MRLKSFFFLFFLIGALGFTQAPEKFTYQSVIKNSSGYLLKNQAIGLRISILFNSSNGMSVYSEEHSVESNSNGLVTLTIGDGVSSDIFSDIDWGNGEYYLKVEVDPEGGINYIMNQTSQLLSVPYALYAGNSTINLSIIGQSYISISGNQITASKLDASNDITGLSTVAISGDYTDLANTPILFDGDYISLTNKPTLFDGDYANLTNTPTLFDGDYTSLTNKPTLFDGDYANLTNTPTLFDGDYANLTNTPTLFDGDYANLTNTPTLFDGDYANLTNKPTLFDGDYANLTNTPTLFDGDYANLTNKPTLFDGDYANLTNTPTLFDGDYANLTNTPTLFDGDYANLTNKPTLFDGDYTNLTNKPELEEGKIYMGDSDNSPTEVAVTGDVTLANNGAVTIADDAVTTAKLANITRGSILVGGVSDAPTVYDAKTDGQILVGDGTDIASVAVTGDVTLANNGAVTIADDAVTTAKLANITRGSILVGGASDAPTVYDAKTDGQILVGDGTDIASVAVTGDVTLANNGAVTIADDAVTNAKIANATIDLAAKVTGVLPIAQGGTGANYADGARTSLGFISGTLVWSNKDSGSGATATFSVSGISASSIVTGAIKSGGNNTSIYSITPNTDEITFTLSGTPSSSAVIMYISIN
jgi:hypothetical protein